MKRRLLKNLTIISALVLTLSTSVLADGGGKKIEQRVDGVKATLILAEDKAKTGENELTLKLYDDKDKPMTNANVKVTAEMEADGDMSGHNMKEAKPEVIQFKEGHEEGEYIGTVKFSDKGHWKVKADFTTNNGEKMADFSLDVISSGPNWFVVGGFVVVTTLIIVTAGITKKKNKKTAKA